MDHEALGIGKEIMQHLNALGVYQSLVLLVAHRGSEELVYGLVYNNQWVHLTKHLPLLCESFAIPCHRA